ncbi:hypothetical protein [uncultured Pseudodesulfovibrio sp.]|uniref:hypothetical protein n=1 Tax=uncultured Pseudodesulfovibrio sp. TaxID=2035858 RepID=UPI0029C871CB|nr:hypothetical protein [uncultured Pseudodesulfovibrio sp.]
MDQILGSVRVRRVNQGKAELFGTFWGGPAKKYRRPRRTCKERARLDFGLSLSSFPFAFLLIQRQKAERETAFGGMII